MQEVSEIFFNDKNTIAKVDNLLSSEGIHRDKNLDYLCGIFDDDFNLLAVGGCFKNTLRCFAVENSHQGENLLNELITHLMDIQYQRGNSDIFIYTKCSTAKFFSTLGFYEIARVNDEVVFMENHKHNFDNYLKNLQHESPPIDSTSKVAAIVMNANPFTLGHQYLVKKAAVENDLLHIFIVSEDVSEFSFAIRKQLVVDGTKTFKNIIYHDSGAYIISNATFPSYFQKSVDDVSKSHAMLDAVIFEKIAKSLNITRRYVGDEPLSEVTNIYNQVLQKILPTFGIAICVVERLKVNGEIVSASKVRELIHQNDIESLKNFVPSSTFNYLRKFANA